MNMGQGLSHHWVPLFEGTSATLPWDTALGVPKTTFKDQSKADGLRKRVRAQERLQAHHRLPSRPGGGNRMRAQLL